jgi:hypothetical protein
VCSSDLGNISQVIDPASDIVKVFSTFQRHAVADSRQSGVAGLQLLGFGFRSANG